MHALPDGTVSDTKLRSDHSLENFFFLLKDYKIMFRLASPLALFSLLTASALGSEGDYDYEWNKYQCNLPDQDRPPEAACFCGFLKDHINGQGQEASTMPQQQALPSTCTEGNAGGYPCNGIDFQALVNLSTFDSSSANDVWGWTDPTSTREFALIGLKDGTGFVEITNPSSPTYLGKLPTATVSSSWRDIKTYQNYAYIVSEAGSHGMQVFDLTSLLNLDGNTPATFSANFRYTEFGNAHNIVINEDTGFAYAVGSNKCSGGLHMIDISNPASPTPAGCYSGDGYVHDAHCVVYKGSDAGYQDNEICFCSNEDTVTIVDVTNKASPSLLSRTPYNSRGYTHQGWLSEDHNYFLFGDETDEIKSGFDTKTLVMDVKNLEGPTLAGSYFGPTQAIDHNLYNVGDLTYLASYRAGLRIMQMDDLSSASFTEIGYFDTYPSSNSANFNGAWSVYPFFASGNIIVSGIEQGLFILSPSSQAPQTPPPSPSPQTPPPSPSPQTPPPSLSPQTPSPTPSDDCTDDDAWSFENSRGKIKKCNWVGSKPNARCNKVGSLNNEATLAYEACPVACSKCPGDCNDSSTWIFITSKLREKSCTWVANKPLTRCSKIGTDNGESVPAGEACREACDTCP